MDQFGGIEVEESRDKFGGIAVEETPAADNIKLPSNIPGMGPFGPAHPEELLSLPDVLKIPGALVDKSGIPQAASDLMTEFQTRTGIDPSAQSGVQKDIKRIPIGPGPLDLIAPKLKARIESELGKFVSPFTEPGQQLMAPLAGLKPVQAMFGAGAVSAIPESVEEIASANTPEDAAAAALKGGANLGMAYLIGKNLARGKPTLRERTADAIQPESKEVLRPVQQQERPVEGAVALPADAPGKENVARGPEEKVKLTPKDLQPALLVNDEPITGGENHDQIRDNAIKQTGDADEMAVIIEASGKDKNHIFLGPEKERLTRREAADALGEEKELHSERLSELKVRESKSNEDLLAKSNRGEDLTAGETERLNKLQSEKATATVAEPVGMGGATPEEVEPTGTELKNAAGEMERIGLGLPEAYPTVRKNMGKAWIKSGEVEAKAPGSGEKLAADLIADPERGMTDEDSALLLRHKVELFNRMNDAAERTHIGDPASRAAAQAEHSKLSEQYLDLLDAIKFRGSQWGREGRWRQALAKEDYNFESADEINRYHRTHTGEDLSPEQKVKAEKVAKGVKEASGAVGEASDKLQKRIRQLGGLDMNEAEKRAFDAVWKTVREHIARMTQGVTKTRVENVVRDMEVAGIQAERAQAVIDAKTKQARDTAIKLSQDEIKRRADPSKPLWEKAKEYLDQGMDNFDDIRNKLATDFGMKVDEVTRLLAQDKRAKYLADDLWKKQQDARRLKDEAKRWLIGQMIPYYQKALGSVPKVLFGLKVGFHGTVALGTHAPMVGFDPVFFSDYVRNFGKMYKMVGNRAYYEMQIQDLIRRPNFIKARRAGLVNDPKTFEDYNSPDTSKYFGNLTGMGNRGYSVLKILRQDMFDHYWNQLPKIDQIPEVAEKIANDVNHSTGVVKGKAPRGTNLALFAPRLEASRVMWVAGDPLKAAGTFLNWKNASRGEQIFAQQVIKSRLRIAGTMMSLLALNAGVLAAVSSKQKINVTDPFSSDFLKFKAAGMDFSYGNAMLSMARLPLRLWVGIKNEGKLNKIIYEDENTAKTLFDYARSQASPFMGLLLDLAFGRDFQQRPLPRSGFGALPGRTTMPKRLRAQGMKPYTWPEFWTEELSPIPFSEAIREVWGKGMGMSDKDIKRYATAMTTIAVNAGTGGRLTEEQKKR